MERVIDFYLDNNEIGEEVVIGWLQGADTNDLDEQQIDLTTISTGSFAEQFTDKLHQSLDWLLKQAVTVPLSRPLTLVNKKSSLINENFQVKVSLILAGT